MNDREILIPDNKYDTSLVVGKKRILDGSRRGAKAGGIALVCALLASMVVAADAGAADSFEARGSVEQVYATGLTPGASVTLYDGQSQEVETRSANDLGGALFRNVTPGDGYRVGAPTARCPNRCRC